LSGKSERNDGKGRNQQVQGNNEAFVILKELIASLNEWQAAAELTQFVDQDGFIVAAGQPLESAHGLKGEKMRAAAVQETIKGDALPLFPDNPFGAGTVEGIGMSKATIFDLHYVGTIGWPAAGGEATEKESVPLAGLLQKMTGRAQPLRAKAAKEDIVLKDQDMPGASCQALRQAAEVRMEDAAFRIFTVFGDDQEFDSFVQADGGELSLSRQHPVGAAFERNAVAFVEEVPAEGLRHPVPILSHVASLALVVYNRLL